ncbi:MULTISPECIES: DMT family transporter [unclassified Bradyrhizobium]|uniref:DMT family transporter n=1 Tax=unclassified Bradyrhizobium TaxID=2631580 RepID=UPI0020A1E88C|nr:MULTISPECIES: DMT family transporter [unclassified Bradyrhizobium]
MLYDITALTAALRVALSNIISPPAIRHLGPVRFNCWRLGAALIALIGLVAWRGAWSLPTHGQLLALILSSAVGIVLGDSLIYAAMSRLGPRRTALLYTSWSPFAALLGYAVLRESLSLATLLGIGLVVIGVSLAISYRDVKSTMTSEETKGTLAVGVLFGLLGGLSAAGAVLIARPVMAAGVDPATAAAIRASVGLVGLLIVAQLPGFRSQGPMTGPIAIRSAASGLLGMGAGMTLVLFALSARPVGVVSALSATTPVLILPLLWLVNRSRPAALAWIGAAVAVVGIAAISSGY